MLFKLIWSARQFVFSCLCLLLTFTQAEAQEIVPSHNILAISPDAALQADFDNGSTIYDNACAACHGETGQGVQDGGPALTGNLGLSQTMQVIHDGSNTMPAFNGLSEQELVDISTFVVERMNP